jgi:ribosomal-protein-alanine N-acetyltransferase
MREINESRQTDRLLLRKPQLIDAVDMYREYTVDSDVTRFVTWHPHTSVDETRTFIKYCLDAWDEGKVYSYVVSLKGLLTLSV